MIPSFQLFRPCLQRHRGALLAAAAAGSKSGAAALPADKAELKKLSKVGEERCNWF